MLKRSSIIGVAMRIDLDQDRYYAAREYTEAVLGSGGVPLHIPPFVNKEFAEAVVSRLDGLMLVGSDTDVDPARYGEEPHPKLGLVNNQKDESDILLIAEAERKGIPILGICYGCQVLCVSRGGSLLQDIEAQVENPIKHSQGKPRGRASHSIEIVKGSKLEKALGVGDSTIRVNSHHHQAINRLGRNLSLAARSSDGMIEAIEDSREEKWIIGVQWHPECSWQGHQTSVNLFRSFIEVCSQRDLHQTA
ncbi:MAG TPA: gamma-glutamyl-gamma-aminobutyrate hydrolase family protein [Pyrinomonadaceae bacterium]|nr:gamma-glutamyl-gamma-aminobutyrate hydrolase family protein [Pyrinomonadaceae bacterium]